MKLLKILFLTTLTILFFSCSKNDQPSGPDWSNTIKGKWLGTGIDSTADTIHVLMILDAKNNVITGTADVSYNSEKPLQSVINGKINDQTITIAIKHVRATLNYTGTFNATNPSIIEGTMTDTRYGTMQVKFLRRWT